MGEEEIPKRLTLQKNDDLEEFANDVAVCLASKRKNLSPKYLYDEVGSQLFEQICLQPEYYITRVEASLLENYAPAISNLTGSNINIIELGSGSSSKTAILLSYLLSRKKRISYYPIDISSKMLIQSELRLKSQFPNVHVKGINSNYDTGIDMAAVECMAAAIGKTTKKKEEKEVDMGSSTSNHTTLMLFLGSSIGNFEVIEAKTFLRALRQKLRTKDLLLVGFDLQKEESVLNSAYNDKAGVTARFNLNLLTRINRELGGNFDLRKFEHFAFYNHNQRRIEMHLVSRMEQKVRVGAVGKTFSLNKEEGIHTENSYKYNLAEISDLAESSGFKIKRNFVDKKRWFTLTLLSPA